MERQLKWKVSSRRSDDPTRVHSHVFVQGFRRLEGMEPQTIETISDAIVELLEGGFLDESEYGKIISFHIEEVEPREKKN